MFIDPFFFFLTKKQVLSSASLFSHYFLLKYLYLLNFQLYILLLLFLKSTVIYIESTIDCNNKQNDGQEVRASVLHSTVYLLFLDRWPLKLCLLSLCSYYSHYYNKVITLFQNLILSTSREAPEISSRFAWALPDI